MNANSLPPLSSAERMKLYRRRKKDSMMCLLIELRPIEIEILVRRGFLAAEKRNDRSAVINGLYAFLDEMLN